MTLRAKPVAGNRTVQLPRQHKRAKREAALAIRFASVAFCRRKSKPGMGNLEVQMALAQ